MARPTTPPNTQTQTSHAVTLWVNGILIGAVNGWSPTQSMGVTPVFEFGHSTGPYGDTDFGTPFEKVPGNVSSMTVNITRYDIFKSQMELAFGTADLTMLSHDPGMTTGGTGIFDVRESWKAPDSSQSYDVLYLGCWLTQVGRSLSTTGDRLVNVNATLEYTQRTKLARG